MENAMNKINYEDLYVDQSLPPLTSEPITRQTLAIYCGASGDHNPIHVDSDFAKQSGLDDVIAHGMLIMAYTSRMLLQWVPQQAIREFDTRFRAMTHIGDEITVTGKIVEKFEEAEMRFVRVEVVAANQHGDVKTTGTAVINPVATR